ncbi:MAG: hypothetical protein GY861_12925 [bacterium]|nr:hypothetical protein [bacterium]
MTPLELLEKAKQQGLAMKVEGDRLLYHPLSAMTSDLKEAIRKYKGEIIELVSQTNESEIPPRIIESLQKAISKKEEDLAIRRKQLADPKCPNPEFCIDQITSMEGHIVEINRYIKEGGDLAIPRCCLQHENYCFLNHAMAMKGFDGCLLSPDGCEFGLRL